MQILTFTRGMVWCLFLLSISVSDLFAQEAEEGEAVHLGEVVVTATKTEVPLEEVASSVYIIDHSMIEQKKASTVLEILRDAPGLNVVQLGGPGGQTSVFLRGGNSNYTLVLIDGVRANDPLGGRFDFANLTTDNIERIEIIYGPQGTLYGSDAIGGVIQIITKKGKGPLQGHLFGEGGSFGTHREGGGISGAADRLDYSLEVSHTQTDGISKADKRLGNPERDGYDNLALSSRVGIKFLGDGKIDFIGRFLRSETDLDGTDPSTGLPVDDTNFEQRDRQLSFSTAFTKPVTDWWEVRLEGSLSASTSKFRDPENPAVATNPAEPYDTCIGLGFVCVNNNSKTVAQQRFVDFQNTFHLSPVDVVTAGYEYYKQKGGSRSFFGDFDGTNENHGLYLQFLYRTLKPVIVTTGIRHEINSHFGDKTAYKLDIAYLLPVADGKIHANYGTGFRAPTLVDLFFPGFSNPNLKPETSESYELGFHFSPVRNTIRTGATYFYNNFTNLIAFDPALFIPVNVAKARTQGVSIDMEITPVDQIVVRANYTYLVPRNLETQQDLLRRPRNKLNLSLDVTPVEALHVNINAQYVSSRLDISGPPDFVGRVGAYTLIGVAARYEILSHVQLYARIDNLLNRVYEESNGFGTARLSAYGGVRVSL